MKTRKPTPKEQKVIEKLTYHAIARPELAFYGALGAGLIRHLVSEEAPAEAMIVKNTIVWHPSALQNFKTAMYNYLHEIGHLAMGHPWRLYKHLEVDEESALIAADYELERVLAGVEAACADILDFGDYPRCPREYMSLAAEEIFADLRRKRSGQGPGEGAGKESNKPDLGLGGGAGLGGEDQSGEGEDTGPGKAQLGSAGGKMRPGDFEGMAPSEAQELIDKIKVIAFEVAQIAKAQGSCPLGLEEMLSDLEQQSEIDYKALLAEWAKKIHERVNSRPDWTRIHSRYVTTGVVWPKKKPVIKPCVLLARDTSGSMSNRDIARSIQEAMAILDESLELILVDCDSQVHRVERIDFDKIDSLRTAKGRGGTSYRPVFELARDLLEGVQDIGVKPSGIVYITDFLVSRSTIEECEGIVDLPVVWLATERPSTMPNFGTVVLL
ncbi:MAG: VWA-like domain-containing protein [Candidatus Bilamarchaeaceae archaeon]